MYCCSIIYIWWLISCLVSHVSSQSLPCACSVIYCMIWWFIVQYIYFFCLGNSISLQTRCEFQILPSPLCFGNAHRKLCLKYFKKKLMGFELAFSLNTCSWFNYKSLFFFNVCFYFNNFVIHQVVSLFTQKDRQFIFTQNLLN